MVEKALMMKLEKELTNNKKLYMRELITYTEMEELNNEIIEKVFALYDAYKEEV